MNELTSKINIKCTKESKKGEDMGIRGPLTGRHKNAECFVGGLFTLV
jgi:hypothetical protein